MIDQHRGHGSFRRATDGLHEWPLVVFTALAIPGAGVFAARLLAELVHLAPARTDVVLAAATVALFTGLVASLAHLGRPLRAPLALRRAGRNALSTEVALAAGLLVLAVAGLVPGLAAATGVVLLRGAGVVALGLLAAFGLVYFLPARWPWRTALVATPMVSGLAAGTIALLCAGDAPQALSTLALLTLLVDAAIFAVPWMSRPPANSSLAPAHPRIFKQRHALVALRFVLVNVAPASLLVAHLPWPDLVSIAAGLLVDRFTFYGVALILSTESEVQRVERLISRAGSRE
jgi:DMSO reductase anchor subunit